MQIRMLIEISHQQIILRKTSTDSTQNKIVKLMIDVLLHYARSLYSLNQIAPYIFYFWIRIHCNLNLLFAFIFFKEVVSFLKPVKKTY